MQFWKNKRVLISGASGFVGTHLTKELIKKDAKVITISRRGLTESSLLKKTVLKKIHKDERGPVEEFDFLNNVIKKNKIDIVFHLAAQPLVEIGKTSPLPTFETNIKGVWNILEASRKNKVDKVVIASTTHVYGDNPNTPYKEEYYPQPSRPYETSKACADLLAQSFADTYGLPVEIARFSNIYGPHDMNFGRLIPSVIRSILGKKSPKIWDSGTMRDFLYIRDAIDSYLMIAEKDLEKKKRLRVLNIGSGKPVSITDLVYKIIAISGSKLTLDLQKIPAERKKEIPKQFISIDKAREVLGWVPKVSLNSGLKKTIDWYRKHL